MAINLESENANRRLAHIKNDLYGDTFCPERISRLNNRIVSNEENAVDCILRLESYAVANGIYTWFESEDLNALKNWFYVRGKLEFISTKQPYDNIGGSQAYENRALNGLFYLISDHSGLIRWYSDFDNNFNKKDVDNPGSFEYWTQQFFVALRGEWDVLTERCERIFSCPPKGSREKKFMLDHKFYLALAEGDISGMEMVIEELVTNKPISRRVSLEGGYLAGLICSPAIIYSKLAWRHGYKIQVDSSYIPKEWLPIVPLDSYDDTFDFMRKYPIPI